MKKILALVFALCMLMGLLCACDQEPAAENGETPGGIFGGESNGAKELISNVRVTSTYNRNGEISEDEIVMEYDWSGSGVRMEGYQIGDDVRADVVLEGKLDSQNRPISITQTIARIDGENRESKVEFSYPGDGRQIATRGEISRENIYDAQGRLVKQIYDDFQRTYEYDAQGNCTRERIDYEDGMDAWEQTTTYTYDDSGKMVFSVSYNLGRGVETQTHYYYYPNGNVMYEMEISGSGDVNSHFSPYNTKDYLSWSYGATASAGENFTVEKDARGYIVKVTTEDGYYAGKTATFDYDAKGNLIKATAFSGRVSTFVYDAENRPVKTVIEEYDSTATTVYAYDAQGRLVRQERTETDGSNAKTTYAYNEAGMVTCKEEKRTSIYTDETVISEEKIEIQYVENSCCKVDKQWEKEFMQYVVSGAG